MAITASISRKVIGYLDIARKEEGATVLLGGTAAQRRGWKMATSSSRLFWAMSATAAAWRAKIFGPIMAVIRFQRSEEEAIAIANDSDYGLGAGVWTENMRRAIRVSHRLAAGSVYVNSYRVVRAACSPFGGYKNKRARPRKWGGSHPRVSADQERLVFIERNGTAPVWQALRLKTGARMANPTIGRRACDDRINGWSASAPSESSFRRVHASNASDK